LGLLADEGKKQGGSMAKGYATAHELRSQIARVIHEATSAQLADIAAYVLQCDVTPISTDAQFQRGEDWFEVADCA
jgi:hypothetical protein